MDREILINTAETGNQVVLEGTDSPFSCIAVVDSRRNKLVVDAFSIQAVI